MAKVGRSCVDRYEAHLVRLEGDREVVHPHAERPVEGIKYYARSQPGVFPQAYISALEAAEACANSGKRLCTLREWYRACRGGKAQRYPYGRRHERGYCNHYKPHLLSKLYGTNNRAWTYEAFNDPKLNLEPGFLAKTGEYSRCVSDYGIYDAVGNLHEWVSDKVDGSLPDKVPLEQGVAKKLRKNYGHGVFMGGFFSTTSEHGPGCEFTTIGHEQRYHDYSTGFRCCKDAESD